MMNVFLRVERPRVAHAGAKRAQRTALFGRERESEMAR
jgi:hypothetical protein